MSKDVIGRKMLQNYGRRLSVSGDWDIERGSDMEEQKVKGTRKHRGSMAVQLSHIISSRTRWCSQLRAGL
jgi:hypothetical protein